MENSEKIVLGDVFGLDSFKKDKQTILSTFDEILANYKQMKSALISQANELKKTSLLGDNSGADLKEIIALTKQLEKVRADLNKADDEIAKTHRAKMNSIKELAAAEREALKNQREVIKNEREAQKEYGKTKKVIDENANSIEALTAKLKRLVSERKSATIGSEDFKKLTKEINATSDALKKADPNFKRISNIGNYFKDTFKAGLALTGIGTAVDIVGGILKDAWTNIKEFNQGMADLSALTGFAGNDLAKLQNSAKKTGIEMGVSAKDVVKTYQILASKSDELLKSGDALAYVTKQAIILSQASGLELPAASEKLVSAMNQFNIPAKDAGKAIDILAAAAQAGGAEVPQLAEALEKMGSTADLGKVSLQESAAMIELLSSKSKLGAEAGTALRNVLLKMQTIDVLPKEAQDQLAKFGVNLEIVKDQTLPVSVRLKEFSKISKDAAAMSKVFGVENLEAGAIILNNIPRIEELTKAVDKNGSAQEQAAIRMDTLKGDMQKFGATWDGLVLKIENGEGVFGKVARSYIQVGTALMGTLDQATTGIGKFFDQVSDKGGLTNWVANLASSINSQTDVITELDPAVSMFAEKVKSAKEGTMEYMLATKYLQKQMVETYGEKGQEMFDNFMAKQKAVNGAMTGINNVLGGDKKTVKTDEKITGKKILTDEEKNKIKTAKEKSEREKEKRLKEREKEIDAEIRDRFAKEQTAEELLADKVKVKSEMDRLKELQTIRNAENEKYLTYLEIQHNKELELLREKGATEEEIRKQQFENAKAIELAKQEVGLMNITENIDLLKKTGGDATEIETLSIGKSQMEMTNKATRESQFKEEKPLTETIFGINKDKFQTGIDTLTTFASEYEKIMSDSIDRQAEMAQRQIDLRQKNIDSLQQEFDNEKSIQDARIAAGSAADTKKMEDIQQRMENEKKMLEDAEKKAEAARIKKEKLDRAMLITNQLVTISNLIVSASEIVKNNSGIPIVGLPLAIAGVASLYTMFKAFSGNAKKGFKKGGYTGDVSPDQEAGVVHGREYVVPERPTKNSKKLLNLIHKGKLSDLDLFRLNGLVVNGNDNSKIEKLLTENNKLTKDLQQKNTNKILRGNGKLTIFADNQQINYC